MNNGIPTIHAYGACGFGATPIIRFYDDFKNTNLAYLKKEYWFEPVIVAAINRKLPDYVLTEDESWRRKRKKTV